MAIKREQRIKMRLHGHPVKFDGTVTDFDKRDQSFRVTFDGPIEDKRFWPWGQEGRLVTDKAPVVRDDSTRRSLADGAEIWEVL